MYAMSSFLKLKPFQLPISFFVNLHLPETLFEAMIFVHFKGVSCQNKTLL
jgi:hypothetical protein